MGEPAARHPTPVLVVHGGAGNRKQDLPDLTAGCRRAAEVGAAILTAGGSAIDAVEAAVRELEENPVFNAGTGGALTRAGQLELDACIMEGTDMRAGGVAALPPFLHPVSVARAALEDGRHALYAGRGAGDFAVSMGFTPSSVEEMRTTRSVRRLQSVVDEAADSLDTVGAVALDEHGHLAAATSTGGTVGQLPGRVGDTPVVGSGTYADDALGACSATGRGEAILRACLAFRATSLLSMLPVEIAAQAAVRTLRTRFGGKGGLILINAQGEIGINRSTRAMSHAWARGDGPVEIGS